MIEIDDELLGKALLMVARTKWRGSGAGRDFEASLYKPTEYGAHEPAAEIERMWNVPPHDPWLPQRQTWINEARSLKEAIAAMQESKP